jgi:D-sedoheptulose 7-phosphate isomerase
MRRNENKYKIDLYKDINESLKLKNSLKKEFKSISKVINLIYSTIKNGKKVFICGNGGSAADAQHLSAEFLVRLRPGINRKPYPLISLALDTSTLTACGNDYNFKYIFSRNLDALGDEKDTLICISTSGNSPNILEVLKKSKRKKINSISLLGFNGGKAKKISDFSIIVKNRNVARIQECHIFLGHFILQKVEEMLIKNS